MLKRNIYTTLWHELAKDKAMIFMAGPRQTGKTTLAGIIAEKFTNSLYFNYDIATNKKIIIEDPYFFEKLNRKDSSKPLVILDEIHKYKNWKNYLKGVVDAFSKEYDFLILGSGRLNIFQKGGESLAGRYFLFSLHPFTLAELANRANSIQDFLKNPLHFDTSTPLSTGTSAKLSTSEAREITENDNDRYYKIWKRLEQFSGFPEPYINKSDTHYLRWTNTYNQQLIREDIRNMTDIKNIDDVEILFSLLPGKVGSPISMDSLARDIRVSFNSIKNWLQIFENFFLCFRLSPWTKKITRAITKEKKLYLYNYAVIQTSPEKFENMIAVELHRAVSNWNDLGYGYFGLHYIRNKEKEEVDFLISNNNNPILLIEAKSNNEDAAKSLLKHQNALNIPAVQLVNKKGVYRYFSNNSQKILIISAHRWLAELP